MKLLCLIRKVEVVATPEERVRQALLHTMIQKWGYPASLISVEKSLTELSSHPFLPRRRVDIVAYYNEGETLEPLLLIECKAERFQEPAWRQLLGYNHTIQAPFFAIGAKESLYCFSSDGTPVEGEPYFQVLLGSVTNTSPSTTSTG
ncbi:MAG TPA: type I restriction enzyme HsdR N-terminal domain-containing protein [Chlamydiales bacterium]|nr:type I restriction enzyme HsdR N-terminal domain-containing protein [Chlamydiales bacterium]